MKTPQQAAAAAHRQAADDALYGLGWQGDHTGMAHDEHLDAADALDAIQQPGTSTQ